MDKLGIVSICIDDFALKKRQRYGTVMVNLETRKIVDMLESREAEDVSKWLAEYPNIKIVSRDGSQQYATAITAAHPEAIQVSDRFHIVKNLNERAKDVYKRIFQGRISIPLTSGTRDFRHSVFLATVKEQIEIIKDLRIEGHSKNEIVLMTGLSERVVNNCLGKSAKCLAVTPTVRGQEHIAAVNKVQTRINQVKNLKAVGMSITKISQITGFGWTAVKNYLSDEYSPVNGHYGKQREGKLAPYRDEVFQLRIDGVTYKEIHKIIKAKGYSGTQDAIRGFITKEQRTHRDLSQFSENGDQNELIDKKWMFLLLYKPNEELRGISEEQLKEVFNKFPLSKIVYDLVKEFKFALASKKASSLSRWIAKAAEAGIPEFDKFINGLKKDYDAVENAFTLEVSNGLAEGTINKIKLIKRIMYGRCHFDLLRNKCLIHDYN